MIDPGNGFISLQEWQAWGTTSPVPAMVTKIVAELKALETDIDAQMSFGGSGGKLQVFTCYFYLNVFIWLCVVSTKAKENEPFVFVFYFCECLDFNIVSFPIFSAANWSWVLEKPTFRLRV